MNFEEHAAKPLLAAEGIRVPSGRLVESASQALNAAAELGKPVVVKAQVPTGKRGKAGGIKSADNAEETGAAAAQILGMEIAGHRVERVLVEEQCVIAKEYYAAILNDAETSGPLVLFSVHGGMDIEEIAATHENAICRFPVDIRKGFEKSDATGMLNGVSLQPSVEAVADVLVRLYQTYRNNDAELVEINPLVATANGDLIALDCKFVLDDSSIKRQATLAANAVPEVLTSMEAEARDLGFKYIDLDGDVGVLANGAGLTMTTMDVVKHYGARPANFLEIGGDAYTLAKPALALLLSNSNIKSLVVNFCGAFARTDVMVKGVISAWTELNPELPIFFSVHGTGEEEAVAMLRAKLGIEPFNTMDEAIQAAIASVGEKL